VGYGLFIVTIVVVSYLLGTFNLSSRSTQDIDLDLMMSERSTPGHIPGTDFIGRNMPSWLILGIRFLHRENVPSTAGKFRSLSRFPAFDTCHGNDSSSKLILGTLIFEIF
jgi:hypothetical protein